MDQYRTWLSGLKRALLYRDDQTLNSTINIAVCILSLIYSSQLIYEYSPRFLVAYLKEFVVRPSLVIQGCWNHCLTSREPLGLARTLMSWKPHFPITFCYGNKRNLSQFPPSPLHQVHYLPPMIVSHLTLLPRWRNTMVCLSRLAGILLIPAHSWLAQP